MQNIWNSEKGIFGETKNTYNWVRTGTHIAGWFFLLIKGNDGFYSVFFVV